MERIDFVLTWVDGTDPAWLADKQRFERKETAVSGADDANMECRYRADTDILRFWFRAVEKFAPWMNRIHFVTCGQKPEWLNETHPKLHWVNHRDYIPSEYLPTFNSNVIELNYHRINDLSEHFVLFNDDMILTRPISPEFYFRNGVPVLMTDLRYPKKIGYNNWSRIAFNDYCLVNRSFDIGLAIRQNKDKWFSVRDLGLRRVVQNVVSYVANKTLPVGLYGHVALPHLKSTLQEIWDRYPDIMLQTTKHKFRTDDQVNQWLLCAWNQAKGIFYPVHENGIGRNFSLSPDNIKEVCDAIIKQHYPQICINDTQNNIDPDRCAAEIVRAFETILPQKSSFEKE